MKEEVLQFGKENHLVGIFTYPSNGAAKDHTPTFIFLNSGFIHRVGFGQVYVKIARELAQLGFSSFRMDSSGIGDSISGTDGLQIKDRWVSEVRGAMDLIFRKTGAKRFVLVGNCSGAELSLKTASNDQRVVGAVLINPMSDRMSPKFYIRLGLFMPSMWFRIMAGKLHIRQTLRNYFKLKSIRKQRDTIEKIGYKEEIVTTFRNLTQGGCHLFMIHCEWDPNIDFFHGIYKKGLANLVADEKIKVATIKGMNHDFFLVRGLQELTQLIKDWSRTTFEPPVC